MYFCGEIFTSKKMFWNQIETQDDFEKLLALSQNSTVLIFKHSTRCGTSRFALKEFEQSWKMEDEHKMVFCFLDLIAHRYVSDFIEASLGVRHESPQVILMKKGKCVYSVSHSEIEYQKVIENR